MKISNLNCRRRCTSFILLLLCCNVSLARERPQRYLVPSSEPKMITVPERRSDNTRNWKTLSTEPVVNTFKQLPKEKQCKIDHYLARMKYSLCVDHNKFSSMDLREDDELIESSDSAPMLLTARAVTFQCERMRRALCLRSTLLAFSTKVFSYRKHDNSCKAIRPLFPLLSQFRHEVHYYRSFCYVNRK